MLRPGRRRRAASTRTRARTRRKAQRPPQARPPRTDQWALPPARPACPPTRWLHPLPAVHRGPPPLPPVHVSTSRTGGADAARLPRACGAPGRRRRAEDEAPDEAEGAAFQEEEPLEGSDPEESLDETAESSILEDEIAQGWTPCTAGAERKTKK